jgi:GNAT superfamily N-acetyltransferase
MGTSDFSFRKANESDKNAIVEFQLAMAKETEDFVLDREKCSLGVAEVFKNPEIGQYYIAERSGKQIGSLLILSEWSDWRNGLVLWIHSVYVQPSERGKGVFSKFYDYIKAIAVDSPRIRGLRLYVDKRNTHAQSVYRKLGMTNEHYELYEWLKPGV